MKKFIILPIVLYFILGIGIVVLSDPGDVEITIVIPADKVTEFQEGFLAALPIPTDPDLSFIDDPNDPDDFDTGIPRYTKKQWIRKCLIKWANKVSDKGHLKIAADAIVTKNSIPE